MSKRQRTENKMDPINLDRELRPQKQQRVDGASDKIHTDPENLMDNWLISARETRRQRDSLEPRDRRAWEARRGLHPLPKGKIQWWWQYTRNGKQRKWTVRRNDHHKLTLSRKASGLTLDEQSRCSFPSEFGDLEISWIYRDYWVGGDKQDFLDTLYRYFSRAETLKDCGNKICSKYAIDGTIPERVVWRIFACLISELVPEVCLTYAFVLALLTLF